MIPLIGSGVAGWIALTIWTLLLVYYSFVDSQTPIDRELAILTAGAVIVTLVMLADYRMRDRILRRAGTFKGPATDLCDDECIVFTWVDDTSLHVEHSMPDDDWLPSYSKMQMSKRLYRDPKAVREVIKQGIIAHHKIIRKPKEKPALFVVPAEER